MLPNGTVIIVGAGGSAEFGLPTGTQIFDSLLKESKTQSDIAPLKNPVWAGEFRGLLTMGPAVALQSQFWDIQELLEKTFSQSIDLLAYNNFNIEALLKFYTGYTIFKKSYSIKSTVDNFGSHRRHVEPSNKWLKNRVGSGPNWISDIVSKYADNAKCCEELTPDSITFVTFNYDQIIENAFLSFLKSSERFSDATEQHVPKVYHVHGKMDFPEQPSLEILFEESQKIKFIRDTEADFPGESEILGAISSARKLFLVGFDCHHRNADLIKIVESHADKYAVNYDGNQGLRNRLLSLGVGEDDIMVGSVDQKMSLAKACEHGFFDQVAR